MDDDVKVDLLFPPRAIPELRDLRDTPWQELVDHVLIQEVNSIDRIAFVLLMVRIGGCASCHADSFRAMRGCLHCSTQSVRRYRGEDNEMVEQFNSARNDVEQYQKSLEYKV
jgi:hypothetical protein